MATTAEDTCISIFCTECGKPNSGRSKFCFSCGNGLNHELTQSPTVGCSPTVATAPAVVTAPASIAPEFQRFDEIFQGVFGLISCLAFVALSATALRPNITLPQASLSATLVVGCFYLYLLPTHLAIKRAKSNRMAIFAINFFLGWTLIGWVAAISWALMKEKAVTARF